MSWVQGFAEADEVWVPTRWVRDCFVRSGVAKRKIFVIPHGVDTERFHPGVHSLSLPLPAADIPKFKFLFSGATYFRKSLDIVLDTFLDVFSSKDPVLLIVHSIYGEMDTIFSPSLVNRLASVFTPSVVFWRDQLSATQMASLYRSVDCLIHISRSEGFGLGILEAMAVGTSVIVTSHGAVLDFCDERSAYMIPACEEKCTLSPCGHMSVFSMPVVFSPTWAEPDPLMLARAMLNASRDPDTRNAEAHIALREVVPRFTWDQVYMLIKQRLVHLVRP